MGLLIDLCLLTNKFFKKKERPGRKSLEEYSKAQELWARTSLKFFEKHIDLTDKNVLDAGCGSGGKTVFYSKLGCKSITGVDIDNIFVAQAKKFAFENNAENTKFLQGSLDKLPFEDNSFDIVFLNDVLEHIPRPILKDVFVECKRVLKNGGKLCMEFPPWTSYDASHLYDFIYMPWCQVFFSDETLIGAIKKLDIGKGKHGEMDVIQHYEELNKITISEFKSIIKEFEFKVVNYELVVVKDFGLFKVIPFFNKYLTRRVSAVLSK